MSSERVTKVQAAKPRKVPVKKAGPQRSSSLKIPKMDHRRYTSPVVRERAEPVAARSYDDDVVYVKTRKVSPETARRREIEKNIKHLSKLMDIPEVRSKTGKKALKESSKAPGVKEAINLIIQLFAYALLLQEANADEVHQMFEEVGLSAGGLSYAHLHTTIYPKQVRYNMQMEKDAFDSLTEKTHAAFIVHYNDKLHAAKVVFDSAMEQIGKRFEEVLARIEMWVEIFSPDTPRDKRQALALGLGLLGGLTSSYGFSLYSQTKLTHLQRMIDENTEAIMQSVQATEVATSELQTIDKVLDEKIKMINESVIISSKAFRVLEYIGTIERRVDFTMQSFKEWELGVISLLEGRASPYLFHPKSLESELMKLEQKVVDSQNELLHSPLAELYRFEVSLLAEEKGVTVFVHIPIVSTGVLKLFKLQNTPFFDKEEDVIYRFHTDESILAINDDHTRSIAISLAELNTCRRISKMYYCDQYIVLNRRPELSCAGAIFVGNKQEIKSRCTVKVEEVTDVMQVINRTAIRVFSTKGKVRIHNSCTSQQGMVESGKIIQLKPGCHAFSADHWFGATADETSVRDVVTSVVTMDKELLPLKLEEVGRVKNTLKELKNEGESSVTFLKIRRRLAAAQRKHHVEGWSATSIVLAVVSILLVLGLIIYLTALGYGIDLNICQMCIECCWRREQPANEHSDGREGEELEELRKD